MPGLTFAWAEAGAAQDDLTADETDTATEGGTDDADTATDGETTGPSDEALANGAQIYSQLCSACHQAGGAGITGQFPPLLDNPNVDDTEYLITTIRNGREGEIEVLGVTYDGRMPAFSTINDEDVADLVTYIQSGFAAPAVVPAAPGAGDGSDNALPGLTNFTFQLAFLIAGGVAALVLAPRLVSANDRLSMPWLDAWLKTAVIVIGFTIFTVFVPSWAMQTDTVAKLDRVVQDLVGTALWIVGLGAGLWALWYAHREDRI